MQYVPAPTVEGFTPGIACVIGLQWIPNALGVPMPEDDRVLAVTRRAVEEFAENLNRTAVGAGRRLRAALGGSFTGLPRHT